MILREQGIDDCDLFAMNLLRSGKYVQSELAASPPMNFIQIGQNNRFVIRKRNTGDTPHEPVPHRQLSERFESIEREIAIFQPIECVSAASCSLPRNRH